MKEYNDIWDRFEITNHGMLNPSFRNALAMDYIKRQIMNNKSKILDPKTSKEGKEIVDSLALHPNFTSELAKVAEVSIKKGYKPFNWLETSSTTRVSTFLSAAGRHIKQSKLGEDLNKEHDLDKNEIDIKVHHLVYAAYNLLMASQIISELPEHDDRIKLGIK